MPDYDAMSRDYELHPPAAHEVESITVHRDRPSTTPHPAHADPSLEE